PSAFPASTSSSTSSIALPSPATLFPYTTLFRSSDDVLAMAFLTFFNSEKPVLFPDITYSFYDVWAELFRIPYHQIPLDEQFRIRSEEHTSELQSRFDLVCRLLLEKKKMKCKECS